MNGVLLQDMGKDWRRPSLTPDISVSGRPLTAQQTVCSPHSKHLCHYLASVSFLISLSNLSISPVSSGTVHLIQCNILSFKHQPGTLEVLIKCVA